MQQIVDIQGLSKRYTKNAPPAVDNLTLKLKQGEVFGFVGPNGAGKTTTIKMLLNLVHPDSGSGTILGFDIVRQSLEIRRHISYMNGDSTLYQNMRGKDFLSLIQQLFDGGNQEKFDQLCETFKVPFERRIKTYSAGQKQQIALVAALAHDARVLLLDEPTKGLDPSKKKLFLDAISRRAEEGAGVIISSHVLSEIESICQRVSFIKRGRLLADEAIAEARKRLENRIFVSFSEHIDEEKLKIHGVSSVQLTGKNAMLTADGDPRQVIKAMAELPIESLRYRQASLDDLYENLYLEDEEVAV